MLRTIDEVLEALGGPAKVADLCGVGVSAVSNWKSRGCIASGKFLVITEALRAIGKTVDPAVFGMTAARPEEVRA